MNKNNLIHESDESYIVYDENKAWFYFIRKGESAAELAQPICLYRPGNFDLTAEEISSIKEWLMRNLKYGVFQS